MVRKDKLDALKQSLRTMQASASHASSTASVVAPAADDGEADSLMMEILGFALGDSDS